MKNLLFGLTATVLFAFSGNAQKITQESVRLQLAQGMSDFTSSLKPAFDKTRNVEDFKKLITSNQRRDEYCLQTGSSVVDTFTPLTRSQALHSMQSAEWMEAKLKEIKSITDNKVLRAAQLPKVKSC